MLDHQDVLKAMVRTVNGGRTVYVRETAFGYVIRSERSGDGADMRTRSAKFLLVLFAATAIGLWFSPYAWYSIGLTLLFSAVILLIGAVCYTAILGMAPGTELHVDLERRELRSAVITARGESWIQSSARFGEVTEIFLRRYRPDTPARSLCLRIAGEEEPMPVGVGSDKVLLAIHDRLLRDIRPGRNRMAAPVAKPGKSASAERQDPARKKQVLQKIFPQSVPDEQRM